MVSDLKEWKNSQRIIFNLTSLADFFLERVERDDDDKEEEAIGAFVADDNFEDGCFWCTLRHAFS